MTKKRLTSEETIFYLRQYRENNDEKALVELIVGNSALVNYFASKFSNQGLTFEELQSAGMLGLLNAINRFDYINYPIQAFSTYIAEAIKRFMEREIKINNKYSNHIISFSTPAYTNKDGDEITIEDILGTDEDELLNNVIDNMKIEVVRDSLKCLTSKERKIILLRYGLDDKRKKTLEEVAKIFGCTREEIRRQEQKALVKMRHPRNTKKIKDFRD